MINPKKMEDSATDKQVKVPPEYYCPITQEIMFDPVIASDGHVYEREAIETYLKTNKNSPLTREPLSQQLTSIHIIRSSIRQFLENNPTLWKEVYLSSTLINQLIQAIQQGDVKQMIVCLDKDKRLLEKPLQGISLLERVCGQANTQLLQTVIARLKNESLLMLNSEEVVRYLPLCAKSMGKTGIQILVDACGWKADHYQPHVEQWIQQNDTILIKELSTLSLISLKARNTQDQTLLHVAVQKDKATIVSYLIEQKVEIDAVDRKDNTALHIAAQEGYAAIAKLLIEHGASTKLRNKMQQRPSDVARLASHDDLAKQIEQWHQEQKFKLLKEILGQENKKLHEALEAEQQARKKLENKILMLRKEIGVDKEGYLFFKRKIKVPEHKLVADMSKPVKTLKGHRGGVTSLLLLPSGEVVSGSYDRTLQIWNMKTGECVKTLQGHSDGVTSLLLLPSGEVVSGSNDNTLKIWDIKTGEWVKTLVGHKDYVNCLLLLPNGEVVSGSNDSTLKVWNIETGKCVTTLIGHTSGVTSLLLLSSGNVVSGSLDKTLKIWHMEMGKCVKTLHGHNSCVISLLLLPSGEVVSGSTDILLKVWNMKTGECVKTLMGHKSNVNSLLLLPSGEVVSGSGVSWESQDDTLKVWDIKTGEYIKTLIGHERGVTSLLLLPGGEIVSGSYDNTLKIWSIVEKKNLKDVKEKEINEVEEIFSQCKTM